MDEKGAAMNGAPGGCQSRDRARPAGRANPPKKGNRERGFPFLPLPGKCVLSTMVKGVFLCFSDENRANIGKIRAFSGFHAGFGLSRRPIFSFSGQNPWCIFASSNAVRTCKKGGRWILISQSTIELSFKV